MTLRTRLLVGVLGIVIAVGVAFAGIVALQRDQLNEQIDRQLEVFALNADRQAPRPVLPADTDRSFVNFFVGVVDADGELQTLAAPFDDPTLVPDLSGVSQINEPTTVPTLSGSTDRVRAISILLDGRQHLVIAVPMDDADESLRALLLALLAAGTVILAVLGLFVWWMIRHGLRPIRKMTESADAISSGAVDRRVEQPPGETEAARLGRALNLMIDTTRAGEAQRARFVADVSHELRTPLTALQGYTALYEQGSLDDPIELADAMRRIREESGRMRRIVDQLLVLADLDERRSDDRSEVDVGRIVTDVASDIGALQPHRPVEVHVADATTVRADSDQITQALIALTSNALRYTPAESPLVLRAFADGAAVRIEIVDHGPGIDPADAPHVFERFYRADASRARATGGNGLGLAIVAAIASAHDGSYGVSETPGGGATFWISLPRT